MQIELRSNENKELRAVNSTDRIFSDQEDKVDLTLKIERAKTSLRMHFEAQAEVIRRQIGGLEGVRLKLGLSQRKMAQLLLVDPSAWSRWLKDESKAPPHIFRSLQWYLALQEKIPGLTNEYFIGSNTSQIESQKLNSRLTEVEALFDQKTDLEGKILKLEESLIQIRKRELSLVFINIVLFLTVLTLVFLKLS